MKKTVVIGFFLTHSPCAFGCAHLKEEAAKALTSGRLKTLKGNEDMRGVGSCFWCQAENFHERLVCGERKQKQISTAQVSPAKTAPFPGCWNASRLHVHPTTLGLSGEAAHPTLRATAQSLAEDLEVADEWSGDIENFGTCLGIAWCRMVWFQCFPHLKFWEAWPWCN